MSKSPAQQQQQPAANNKQPAATTGGRGSLGAGLSASSVDNDKLWRDRIRQELQFQRNAKEEYAFFTSPTKKAASEEERRKLEESLKGEQAGEEVVELSPEQKSARAVRQLLNTDTQVGSASCAVNLEDINNKDLLELQKLLQKSQYTSTVGSSYKYDRSKLLELGGTKKTTKFRV